jgi:hypothetical protein
MIGLGTKIRVKHLWAAGLIVGRRSGFGGHIDRVDSGEDFGIVEGQSPAALFHARSLRFEG